MGTKIATWSAITCGGSMSPSCRKNSPAPASSSSWRGGEAVFSFGKHAGASLREVAETAPGYLDWMLGADFPDETLAILRDAKEGSSSGHWRPIKHDRAKSSDLWRCGRPRGSR